MNITKKAHITSKRNLKDEFSFKGIFNNALEIFELKDGIFSINFQFAKTKYTDEDMRINICVNFDKLFETYQLLDVDVVKSFAYENSDIEVLMTEEQHTRLTGGNSNYLLPIYNAIISEAMEYLFNM